MGLDRMACHCTDYFLIAVEDDIQYKINTKDISGFLNIGTNRAVRVSGSSPLFGHQCMVRFNRPA